MDEVKCKSIFKAELKDFKIMVKEMIGRLRFTPRFETNITWKADGN